MILSEQELDTQTLSVYRGLAAPSAGVSLFGCCGSAAAYSQSSPFQNVNIIFNLTPFMHKS